MDLFSEIKTDITSVDKKVTLEKHNGITVLRDDLLIGGTKSVLMPLFIQDKEEYVYATTVFGGFQIALAQYCQEHDKKATIFCAKRTSYHKNTQRCVDYGAKIVEVPMGFLVVVQKKAKEYCTKTGAEYLAFGGKTPEAKVVLTNRVKQVIKEIGHEPEEIWCVIGSGMLVECILDGTTAAKVNGVCTGANYHNNHPRLTLHKYPKPFGWECKYNAGFPSMVNYDLKGFEYCNKYKQSNNVLFWNVLG